LKTRGSFAHQVLRDTLKQLRTDAKLSQEALAKRLKKPQSYIWKIEAGERGIDPVEMYHWAEACHVEPLYSFSLFTLGMTRRRRT
jgi:transcriptional regulator with XRE-family HTH domain